MPLETISIERYPARGWVCEVEARDPHGSIRRQIVEANDPVDRRAMANRLFVLAQRVEAGEFASLAPIAVTLGTLDAYFAITETTHARKPDQVAQVDLQASDAEVHRDGLTNPGQPPETSRPTAARPTLSLQDRDQRLRR